MRKLHLHPRPVLLALAVTTLALSTFANARPAAADTVPCASALDNGYIFMQCVENYGKSLPQSATGKGVSFSGTVLGTATQDPTTDILVASDPVGTLTALDPTGNTIGSVPIYDTAEGAPPSGTSYACYPSGSGYQNNGHVHYRASNHYYYLEFIYYFYTLNNSYFDHGSQNRGWMKQVDACFTGGSASYNDYLQTEVIAGITISGPNADRAYYAWDSASPAPGTAEKSITFGVNAGPVTVNATDNIDPHGDIHGSLGPDGFLPGLQQYADNEVNTIWTYPYNFTYDGVSNWEGNVGHALFEWPMSDKTGKTYYMQATTYLHCGHPNGFPCS